MVQKNGWQEANELEKIYRNTGEDKISRPMEDHPNVQDKIRNKEPILLFGSRMREICMSGSEEGPD